MPLLIWFKWLKYFLLFSKVRGSYDEIWDPVTGKFNYFHIATEVMHKEKPLLLGSEPWDPNRVPDWTVDRVLFLNFKNLIPKELHFNTTICRLLYFWEESDWNSLSTYLSRMESMESPCSCWMQKTTRTWKSLTGKHFILHFFFTKFELLIFLTIFLIII